MTDSPSWVQRTSPTLIAVAVAVAFAAGLLWLVDAPPFEAFRLILDGSFGTADRASATLLAWVPLVLASAGLVVTFNAGLWNIGVEGQIVMGAIATAWVARVVPGPGGVVIPLAIVAGIVGGGLWALLAGVLKTRFRVNEIFGGLGLDFVAAGFAIYLVIGPWAREGTASTSGTDLFRDETVHADRGGVRHRLAADSHPDRPPRRRRRLLPHAGHAVRAASQGRGAKPPKRLSSSASRPTAIC